MDQNQVDLILVPNANWGAIAEIYTCEDGQQQFVNDFVAILDKSDEPRPFGGLMAKENTFKYLVEFN